jgi:AcrR family transcriptional regulator
VLGHDRCAREEQQKLQDAASGVPDVVRQEGGRDDEPPSPQRYGLASQFGDALAMEETRRRIAQAVYELHGTIGPAATTISEIARRAGVERLTVYRHFPDELSLYRACLEHWTEMYPWPDPARWRDVRDPAARLRAALSDVYAFFPSVEGLFARGTADLPRLRKLQEADAPLFAHWAEMRRLLLVGWRVRGRRRARLSAAVGLALDFQTWQTLVRREGLSDAEAVELSARAVECAIS